MLCDSLQTPQIVEDVTTSNDLPVTEGKYRFRMNDLSFKKQILLIAIVFELEKL